MPAPRGPMFSCSVLWAQKGPGQQPTGLCHRSGGSCADPHTPSWASRLQQPHLHGGLFLHRLRLRLLGANPATLAPPWLGQGSGGPPATPPHPPFSSPAGARGGLPQLKLLPRTDLGRATPQPGLLPPQSSTLCELYLSGAELCQRHQAPKNCF